jgi:hypothetical protein
MSLSLREILFMGALSLQKSGEGATWQSVNKFNTGEA